MATIVVFGTLMHFGQRSGIITKLVPLDGNTQAWPKLHFIVTMLLIKLSLVFRGHLEIQTNKNPDPYLDYKSDLDLE